MEKEGNSLTGKKKNKAAESSREQGNVLASSLVGGCIDKECNALMGEPSLP